MEEIKAQGRFTTKTIVQTALLVALVFLSTSFINIRLPFLSNGGLVHLGTAMLYIVAIVFGKKKGAIAGSFGMAIFDLVSGWALWAPFTFVIRAIMGYMVGVIAWSGNKEGNNIITNIVAMILSGVWMIIGYYITEVILYGNWVAPITSIPGDITQVIVGLILALPTAKILKKYTKYI